MRLPSGPLFTSALISEAVGFVAVGGLALMLRRELALGGWYPAKAAGLFAVMMLLALGHLHGRHPFARFGPANQLTTARAVLVACVAGLIGEPRFPPVATAAAGLSLAATLLDGVDGWLARRVGIASAFGARFDVEVDALLIQALAVLAWQYGKAGSWVLLSGLMRYGFVGAGWLWRWIGEPLAPTIRGRAICVVQVAALVLVLVPAIRPPLSAGMAAFGLIALCYSFLVDLLRLWRQPARG